MDSRRDIEKKIEKKQQELVEKQRDILTIEAYIAGLQDALKSLPRDTNNVQIELREGSLAYGAKEFLRKIRKPQRLNEILKGIGKELTRENRINLNWSLKRYASQGQIFKRISAGVYGLLEFNLTEEQEEPDMASSKTESDIPEPKEKVSSIIEEELPF